MNEAKIKTILQKVLKDIVPTGVEKSKINHVINFTLNALQKELDRRRIEAEVVLGGSLAKNTWLKRQADIDFFVRFSPKYEKISELLKEAVKAVFKKAETVHGSRDYYKVIYKGYNLEIVPVLKIGNTKDAKNITDVSVFHVDYVKDKIRRNPGLAEQIRLLKAFAKAQGVYGAETHISGISGYVSELLMIHYGSFLSMIKELEKAQPKIYIDTENYFKDKSEILRLLPESKIRAPILLVDPTMKYRNAAAALKYRTFSQFLFSARMFLRSPSTSFFKQKPISVADLRKNSKKRGTLLAMHNIKKSKEKEDIFFAKLRKKIDQIHSTLEKEGLEIYDYGYISADKLMVYFELETLKLSNYKKHFGPPVWVPSEHFDKFIKKWKSVYVSNTNLAVDVKRSYKNIKEFVNNLLKKELR